jgi:hypothetical protein
LFSGITHSHSANVRVVYVTPSHQYPLETMMSLPALGRLAGVGGLPPPILPMIWLCFLIHEMAEFVALLTMMSAPQGTVLVTACTMCFAPLTMLFTALTGPGQMWLQSMPLPIAFSLASYKC